MMIENAQFAKGALDAVLSGYDNGGRGVRRTPPCTARPTRLTPLEVPPMRCSSRAALTAAFVLLGVAAGVVYGFALKPALIAPQAAAGST